MIKRFLCMSIMTIMLSGGIYMSHPIPSVFADVESGEDFDTKKHKQTRKHKNRKHHKNKKKHENRKNTYSLHSYKDLRFGKVVATTGRGGYITINPKNDRKTVSNGLFDLDGSSGAAVFEIKSRHDKQFDVSFPNEIFTYPKKSNLKIKDLTIWPEGILRVGRNGRVKFKIGGTLHLPAHAKSGDYNARITIFINEVNE